MVKHKVVSHETMYKEKHRLSCLYICAYIGIDDAVNLRMGKMGGIKRKGLGKG